MPVSKSSFVQFGRSLSRRRLQAMDSSTSKNQGGFKERLEFESLVSDTGLSFFEKKLAREIAVRDSGVTSICLGAG